MAKNSPSDHLLLYSCIVCIIVSGRPISAHAASLDHQELNTWMPMKAAASCRGSIAECLGSGELSMDSEINRRILATRNYISYGALQRNTVPCSRRGSSYYNCQPGGEANPYTRGCSAITRCRS
nr:rapid alkalinization factor-like [Coffea arabica]